MTRPEAVQQFEVEAPDCRHEPGAVPVLVVGMGASAYGRERRAVTAFHHMKGVAPFFLISKWEDGTVSRLLHDHGLAFGYAPWGYLGRARPRWALTTLLHLPVLLAKVGWHCWRRGSRRIVFLSTTPFLNALPVFVLLSVVARIPLIFYFGDVYPQDRAHRLLAKAMGTLGRKFVVNSEAVGKRLAALGISSRRISTVYNGVCLQQFAAAAPMDFRSRYEWNGRHVLFAFAGQLNARKGVEDFLAAAAIASARNPDCRFLVLGRLEKGDSFQSELERMASSSGLADRVRFTGWIESMAEALAGLDALVVPSRSDDAAPNVVLESMASGKPVIGTRVGGIPELVEDGQTGLLVEKQQPAQLAECILRLAGSPGLRKRMGRAGRRLCARRFDSRRNARAVGEIIRNA